MVVSKTTEAQHRVASVLVVAPDPVIETLVGELVAFAGHRPVYDATVGAAGESIRRVRPNVVLLDTSLSQSVVEGCLLAAEEVGTRPILMSSSTSAGEVASNGDARSFSVFVLPGGPKPLASLIASAMTNPLLRPVITIPAARVTGFHPAMCAALASVGRARALVLHAQVARAQNRLLRNELPDEVKTARQSRLALRAAVIDYARQLRDAKVAEESGLSLVASALRDCATVVGAEDVMATLLEESADWTREVYHAA